MYKEIKIKFNLISYLKNKFKFNLKDYILNLSVKYINWYSKDSNYIKHANNEYKFAWKDYENCEMQSYMCTQINNLLALLATQGDSGFSIGYKLNLLKKLIMLEPISPLTFSNDEFGEPYCKDDIRQNKRNSKVFKYSDGTYSYLDDFIKTEKYYIGESKEIILRDGGNWSGGIYVVPEQGNIYYINYGKIKDITKFTGKSYYIDTYGIEFPTDWWISLCKESDLKEFLEEYTIEKQYNFDKELNYKDGIYKQEILERIEIIKNHMYDKRM